MAWWKSRLRDLRRFRGLTAAERRGLARAALWLLAVDLGLRTVGFVAVRAALDRRRLAAAPPWTPGELARLVDVAARHHVYPMRCLARSLVLQALLREQGVTTELRIGVRKVEKGIEAHAWLESQGRPLGEAAGVEATFLPLTAPADERDANRALFG